MGFGIFGNLSCKEGVWEATEVGTTNLGVPGPPGAPRWVVPTLVASRTPLFAL